MFYTKDQLTGIGFKSVGENVLISDKCSIYNPGNIEIGDNVRIDDFCILSAGEGGIKLGRYIHIACYASMIGQGLIQLDDYSQVAARTSILSSTDDFSGEYLVGPTLPKSCTNVRHGKVHLMKYVVLGSSTVVLPGVTLGEGSATGALSLVSKDLEPYKIYAGSPIRFLKERSKNMIAYEIQ